MRIDFGSLRERYNRGEIAAVWQALAQLDQEQQALEDAQLLAVEQLYQMVMDRVRRNLDILVRRLYEQDYQFLELAPSGWQERDVSSPDSIYTPPSSAEQAEDLARLDELLRPYGQLPLSFRVFLKEVGGVSLVGYFPKWSEKAGFPLLDPLMVFPLADMISFHQLIIERMEGLLQVDGAPYVQFSFDEEQKEGISGSGWGYGLRLYPRVRLDASLVNYGANIDFISYLRLCCKWAGFPNLEWFQQEVDQRFMDMIVGIREALIPF
jgi:hypothetical protein